MNFWTRMEGRGPDTVVVDGVPVGPGSRVRLRPRLGSRQGSQPSRADIFDLALDGRIAVVEAVEQDDEGTPHLAVTLEDDPGRDLGEARLPGHRFFYTADEVEPLAADSGAERPVRVLVAGIGNIFLGDDGFGVEVVRRLEQARPPEVPELPPGVDVVDFGIRGMDLAYALQRDYAAVLFVDAAQRGERPGTLTLLEPRLADERGVPVETHGMDPVQVLRLARELGRIPPRVLILCCEPATVLRGTPDEDVLVELSAPVRAVVGDAARFVVSLVADLIAECGGPGSAGS
ncbi:hydrogenase maturation protease [Microtetraspora sp. NBRC 16547]|uniref:hydrogenase maturation protease n=1 Tax=Microtetraspora sp. NBRC 16547 TaxID=3030993 RepID=UPI002552E3CB|nr:hydrogenase maturation protease [Microtetraspora sp. NBRC 16547]